MPAYSILAALLVILAAAATVCLWHGWRDRRDPTAPPRRRTRRRTPTARTRTLLLAGIVIGAVLALTTGWLIALLLVPAALAGLPLILSAPVGQAEITKLVALDDWVRSLSSVLRAGAGLEHAIVSTHRSVPAAIAPEVTRLIQRLRANTSTATALREFANDLDDFTGDLVSGALIQASQIRGSGLAAVLRQLADSVSEDVRNRRSVEASRKSLRTTARWVTSIAIAFVTGLFLVTDFLVFYTTPIGQLVFLLFAAAFAGTLFWMRQYARPPVLPRFLAGRRRTTATQARAGSASLIHISGGPR